MLAIQVAAEVELRVAAAVWVMGKAATGAAMGVVMEAAAMKEVVMAEAAMVAAEREPAAMGGGGEGGGSDGGDGGGGEGGRYGGLMVVGRAMVDGMAVRVLGVMVDGMAVRAVARAARTGSEGV